MRLLPAYGFGYAREVTSVPLTAVEFQTASRCYPIVFTPQSPLSPVCIVGMKDSGNLFVDEAGQWRPGAYVPAYIRRFPFLLMSDPESKRMVLGVEESSGRLSEDRGDRLFENRQPTPFLNQALSFCADFNRQWDDSLAMLRAFQDSGILIEDDSEIQLGETQSLKLGGFLVVDEDRLNELDEGIFLAWRAKGWLAPLYAHLASRHNWTELAQGARGVGSG
jgi:hypothetical protein